MTTDKLFKDLKVLLEDFHNVDCSENNGCEACPLNKDVLKGRVETHDYCDLLAEMKSRMILDGEIEL